MSDDKDISEKELAFYHHQDNGYTDCVIFNRAPNGAIEITLDSGGGIGPDVYDREIDESGLDRDDVEFLIKWLQSGLDAKPAAQ